MTTPARAFPPMTPDRWRAVDAILKAALTCEPDQRDAFVREACAEDDALRQEVVSLLAAHDGATDDFLERPAMEALDDATPTSPLTERITAALADRYEIEREIARGGMATVYVARDLRHARRVAIKVLRDEVAATVGAERFLEEIRVTASLQHPHILPLFDSGSVGGLLWYVMPFVDGETLRSRLTREGPLPIDEAVRLAREIAAGLEHAHARGVLHRDVKPENVLLQGGHALVADFGIALALEHAGGDRLTRTGLTIGTPQYMAPEQAAGERALDARVDVYALGAVVHEMIAGAPPFAGGSRQVVLQRMLREPPTAMSLRRPEVRPSLDAAVQRALAKLPADRFASAAAFATALAAPVEPHPTRGASAVGQVDAGRPERPGPGRRVGALAAMYVAIAALVVGLAGGWAIARSSLLDRLASAPQTVLQPTPTTNDRAQAETRAQSLVTVDRTGRLILGLPADRPWTPRFSPDGKRVAYGAFGTDRKTSDLWVTDLDAGTTRRLTDDDGDSNDPQWSADGASIAYSVNTPNGKDVATRRLDGSAARVVASRDGTQFPSDWLRDGSALLVTEDAGDRRRDIIVQPADGSAARPYLSTSADETAARISPDGRWVAYTSDASGRAEVYLDTYPRATHRVTLSGQGGVHPVWRADGRELFYWRGDALTAVAIGSAGSDGLPRIGTQTELFTAQYQGGLNTMYDVSPDGQRFVIVRRR